MNKCFERNDIVNYLQSRFSIELTKFPFIKSVLLFGSIARCEFTEKSDLDLLVLHENYNIDILERRKQLYIIISNIIGDKFDNITLIDMELQSFLRPKTITPLLLNIYWDSIVVYDCTGIIEDFLQKIRIRINEVGLKRIKNGKFYYWILPKSLERIKLL